MVIVFLTKFYSPHVGGVETHVENISKILAGKGNTIIIVTQKIKDLPKVEKQNNGIFIYRLKLPANDSLKKYIMWIWLLKNVKILFSSDIIHCHDNFFWVLPFRFVLFFKKFYITFHGYEGICPPSKKSIIVRKISEILSNGNICVGDYIKNWYQTSPSAVTYGGVNKINYKHYDNKFLQLLLIGRLDKDMGIEKIIMLLRLLKKNKIAFNLVVCGNGPYKRQLKKYGNVLGFINNVQRYISKSSVIISSSYLSMLESLIQKKLVISLYDNALKRDYLLLSPFKKFVIVSDDINEVYKDIILYLRNSNTFSEKLEKGYQWAEKQTWEKVVKKYEKIWGQS